MLRKYVLLLVFVSMMVACAEPAPAPLATATAVVTPTPLPTAAPGTLIVDPSVSLGPISPYLLGSNYGPWIAVPVAMLPAAYDSGVKAIRFPGGAWGDRNDLKSYHIDPFIAFTQQVGAIPTISVRLREGTSEQAADLVRYVNIEKGYGVTYWAIGNEPTLFAAELRQMGKADDYDTVQFNREWREFATAMKEVDPSIKLMGPEIHQFNYDYDANPKDSADRDWMTEFLKANGDMVDVVTFHRYPFPRGAQQNVTIADLREHSHEWAQTMVYLHGLVEELTGRDLPIAITEVNTHWNPAIGGEATPDSHYNAIWLAETLGQLIVQDVFMVNHWMLTSPGRQGGWGLIGRSEVRPSYYVFQLYKQFGTELLYANSGVPDVSLYAGRRDDGRLSLLIVNLADTVAEVPVQLSSKRPQQAEMWQLDAEQKPESGTTFTWPTDDIISFPAQSVTLFLIEQSE